MKSSKLFILFSAITIFITMCKEKSNTVQTENKENLISITTSQGTMIMWLYKGTDLHRKNFLQLAESKFYDSTIFHRCVSNFVIQGGDPLSKDNNPSNDGTGGPGYTINAEIDSAKYKHVYGAVGAARDNNPAKASNGSQFYIVTPTNGASFLNGNYTVFGKIISGMNVAEAINNLPKTSDRPNNNVYMQVKIIELTQEQIKTQYNFTQFEL